MPQVKDLLLATNNAKKIKEIRQILGDEFSGNIFCANDFPHLPEPVEDGATFAENARIKADYYARNTGLIALADDSGLIVDALDGRPGVHSARYAPTDPEKIQKLIHELATVPEESRTARFACVLSLCGDYSGSPLEATGYLEGSIGYEPRGSHGFGYDPIFVVHGDTRTLAELLPEEKNSISHRGVAMKKMKDLLLKALVE